MITKMDSLQRSAFRMMIVIAVLMAGTGIMALSFSFILIGAIALMSSVCVAWMIMGIVKRGYRL